MQSRCLGSTHSLLLSRAHLKCSRNPSPLSDNAVKPRREGRQEASQAVCVLHRVCDQSCEIVRLLAELTPESTTRCFRTSSRPRRCNPLCFGRGRAQTFNRRRHLAPGRLTLQGNCLLGSFLSDSLESESRRAMQEVRHFSGCLSPG